MSEIRHVAVIVGSLRQGAYSGMVAHALMELAPALLHLERVPIGTLELYNQDLDGSSTPAWDEFRARVRPADAVLFVSPEYNRSIPGVLKNAVDVGSRPPGQSVWKDKPAAIVGSTPGQLGAAVAVSHLRGSLVNCGMQVMAQPEAYLALVNTLFDAEGKLISDKSREHLTKFMTAFAAWIERFR
jgi:chromate reductase